MVAKVLGEISPKISTSTVRIPVAIPAPALPKIFVARVVAREAEDRFTMLLPIRMALSILPESSVISSTFFARLLPSSAMLLRRILLEVVKAVSAEEKNADNNNKTIITINCMTSLESKYISPFHTLI